MPMSDDDPTAERCPICKEKECQRHLLALFDEQGDQGVAGLVGGPLYDVNEKVLRRARLAWVQSVRVTGKPKAPRWIMKERGLLDYFYGLGRSSVGDFDLENSQSDEDASDDLQEYTDNELSNAREKFLAGALANCGWLGERTESLIDSFPGMSGMYISWWALKPREIVKRFRAKLRKILLDASSTVKATKSKSTTRAKKAKRTGLPRLAKTAGTKK